MHCYSLEQTAAFSARVAEGKKGLGVFGPHTPRLHPFSLALKTIIVVG